MNFPITEVSRFVQLAGGKENEQDTFLSSSNGLATELDEFDFGSNAPGPLLRKTILTYAALGNNILDRVASVTVCAPGGSDSACSGSGTKIAQSTFGYDESPVTATSGITQHVGVSGSRGNLTSTNRWLNTNNTTLSTTSTFDDTGNVLTTTDPGGHQTSYTYGACNGAFLTQTKLPDTNSPNLAHHQTAATYDCNTGLAATSTDQNNQVTKFFYDNMRRPTEIDYPDLGQTLSSYPDPNHITVTRKIDSSRSTSSTTVLDGYGRVSRTAVANGESTPYDQQDSCYDTSGRLSFRSYRYQGNAPSSVAICPNTSLAGDSFAYSVLGLPTHVTHSDGTSTTTSYGGLATQVTDEGNGSSNVSRILQRDGLGRLVSVCELYSGTPLFGNGGTPAACGQDISGTGFLTSYGYDTLGNLTGVTQGTLTSRTYSYDSLSRMTSETTPEAGTVSYSYTPDSLLLTRTRPASNQTNSAVTTVTNYTYDALHRLTTRSYSNDPSNTPVPTFNYDETSVWNTTLNNTTGRLSSESVGGASPAKQIFSYDPMGRAALNLQCTPNTCNATPFSPYSLGYQYDFLGDLTLGGNGVNVTFSDSYNIAGRLTKMTSSLSDGNHPATLFNNAHYGSFGIVSDALGNGLVESVGYTSRGQLNSYNVQNPAAPATGSLTITGSERSTQVQQAATPGQGSVTVNGSLQSKQVQTQAATAGSGSVTINGSENSFQSCYYVYGRLHCITVWDHGTVSVSVNGLNKSVSYDKFSNASGLASSIASAFNGDSTSAVNASVSGATITFTAKTTGSGTNYTLSASSATGDPADFGTASFTTSASGATLTGGADAVFTTVYDSGSCTITVNNHGDSQSWSGSGTTAATIASGLQSSIAADHSAFVSATVSGNKVNLTATTSGAGTNYPLTSSCSYDSGNFSGPSFTTSNSGSALTGGKDAGSQTVYDTGTVTVTINSSPSFSKTVSYGQTDTPTTVASALATALSHNTDPNSPVNTSSSGGTLSFTAIAGGAGTDYAFTSSSATNNANFTGTSFPPSPASGTMSGGTNTTTLYSFSLTPAADGQITSANDFVNGNWSFAYDPFNRLSSSNKNSGLQAFTYGYDRYGNRVSQNSNGTQGGPAPQYVFDNNNRISGSGVSYDALGEILTDGLGNSFTWDAEGRLIQVNQGSTVVATYSYDAEGRRVHGPNGEYVYDAAGNMITQLGLNGVWNFGEIYAAGRHLATYSNGTTNFFHADWLGTKRVVTALNGTSSQTCTGLPFGDGVSCTGTNTSFNGFTDDIHDPEDNLEHTLFRKYSSTEGRWLTPDPAGMGSADPANPQSWNRYVYVTDNAVNAVDPTGLQGFGSGDYGGFGLCGFMASAGCGFFTFQNFPFQNSNCFIGDFNCGLFFGYPNFMGLGMINVPPLNGFGFAPGEWQPPLPDFSDPARNVWAMIQQLLGEMPNRKCAGSDPVPYGCEDGDLGNGFKSNGPSLKDIWDKIDKTKGFFDKLVCTYKIWNCLNTTFQNQEDQLEAQAKCKAAGGDDVQCGIVCDGKASQQFCRFQQRVSGNENCKEVIQECIPTPNPFPFP